MAENGARLSAAVAARAILGLEFFTLERGRPSRRPRRISDEGASGHSFRIDRPTLLGAVSKNIIRTYE